MGALFYSFIYVYSSVHTRSFSLRAKFEKLPAGYEVGSLLHRERLEELYRSHPSFVSNGGHDHEL